MSKAQMPIDFLFMQNQEGFNAERFAYIDFKLYYTGFIRRSDLHAEFGISEVAASNLLSKYKKLRPHNMRYSREQHVNIFIRDSFIPLINFKFQDVFEIMINGFSKSTLLNNSLLPFAQPSKIPGTLNNDNIAKITRAMSCNSSVNCFYQFSSNQPPVRLDLTPLTLTSRNGQHFFNAIDSRDNKVGEFNFFYASKITG